MRRRGISMMPSPAMTALRSASALVARNTISPTRLASASVAMAMRLHMQRSL